MPATHDAAKVVRAAGQPWTTQALLDTAGTLDSE